MDKVRSLGELKANGVSLTDLQNSTVLPRGQDLDQCPVQRGGSEKAVSEISHARGGRVVTSIRLFVAMLVDDEADVSQVILLTHLHGDHCYGLFGL